MTQESKVTLSELKWTAGSHIGFDGKITNTIKGAIDLGIQALQFFLGPPQQFKRSRLNTTDIEQATRLVHRYPMAVFSHAPYLYNLCGSRNQLAWQGDRKQDGKTKFFLHELEYELGVLSNFPVNGVVVHPGCYPNRAQGLSAITDSINKIDFPFNSRLLLENSAGQGNSLATTLDELQTILLEVEAEDNVGVCLDTAHLWGYGDYNLTKCSEVDRLFEEVDQKIGLSKWCLLHLNDSEVKRGAKKDRHALIGTGEIWSQSIDSLVYLLDKCQEHSIPIVLETMVSDIESLRILSRTTS